MSHCSATNRSDVVHNMCKDLSTQWIYVRQCNGWPDALNMLCATMLKYASLKCKSVHLISDYFLKWPFSGHLVFSLLESPSLYHVLQQEQWNPEHYEEPKDNNSIKKNSTIGAHTLSTNQSNKRNKTTLQLKLFQLRIKSTVMDIINVLHLLW